MSDQNQMESATGSNPTVGRRLYAAPCPSGPTIAITLDDAEFKRLTNRDEHLAFELVLPGARLPVIVQREG